MLMVCLGGGVLLFTFWECFAVTDIKLFEL